DVRLTRRLVVPHRVPMEERAATAVLTGDAHFEALREERGIRERFRETPIERQLARRHLLAVLHDLRDLTMERAVAREARERLRELAQLSDLQPGRHRLGPVDLLELGPVDRVLVADHAE